jgi:hypothetical protein
MLRLPVSDPTIASGMLFLLQRDRNEKRELFFLHAELPIQDFLAKLLDSTLLAAWIKIPNSFRATIWLTTAFFAN